LNKERLVELDDMRVDKFDLFNLFDWIE